MRFYSGKRLFGAAAVATIAAIALVGCSSSSNSSADSTSTPASDTTTNSDSGTFASGSSNTLVFGAVPDQANSDANNKPLEDYIAKEMGMTVKYYQTSDYSALIAAMVAGKVDITTSGALQYVMAINQGAQYDPVAAVLSSQQAEQAGDAGYYSVPIQNPKANLSSLADAKGKTVCFVDPNSTSGFLYGLMQLQQAGINVTSTGKDAAGNPQFSDFTAYFAGAHDKSEQAVASGQCALGFAEDSIAVPGIDKGEVKPFADPSGTLKDGAGATIAAAYVPGGPLTIADALPATVKQKLTTVLQGASLDAIKSSGVTLTSGFTAGYFGVVKADKSTFQPIFTLCSKVPAAACAAN